MKRETKAALAAGIVLTVQFLLGWHAGYRYGSRHSRGIQDAATTEEKVERKMTHVDDKVAKPTATEEHAVGRVTVPVEMVLKEPDEPRMPEGKILVLKGKSAEDGQDGLCRLNGQDELDDPGGHNGQDRHNGLNGHDSLGVADDATHGDTTLTALIPIRQKVYKDSSYTAYVSGYRASLDSLVIHSRVVTETRTRYRRWNVGITGGYGIGLVSRKVEPYIGVGVTWNLLR